MDPLTSSGSEDLSRRAEGDYKADPVTTSGVEMARERRGWIGAKCVKLFFLPRFLPFTVWKRVLYRSTVKVSPNGSVPDPAGSCKSFGQFFGRCVGLYLDKTCGDKLTCVFDFIVVGSSFIFQKYFLRWKNYGRIKLFFSSSHVYMCIIYILF